MFEQRTTSGEIEVRQNGDAVKIAGYASVFNRRSENLGGFVEQIMPGAFKKTITEADVRGLYNHDPNMVLGRNTAGTMKLAEDTTGLHYEIDPPATSWARDLMVSMERGDVTQSSFAFRAIQDDWGLTDEDYPLRSVQEASIRDVSVVTYPAYTDATSGVSRSAALAGLAKRSGFDAEAVSDEEIAEAIRSSVSTAAWDGDASRYTPQQWRRACLIDTGEGDEDSKSRYKLPIREPSGALNKNGIHAAASALAGGRGGVDAPEDQKVAAAKTLVSLYKNTLDEDPPESLVSLAGGNRSEPEPSDAEVATSEAAETTSDVRSDWLYVAQARMAEVNLLGLQLPE